MFKITISIKEKVDGDFTSIFFYREASKKNNLKNTLKKLEEQATKFIGENK